MTTKIFTIISCCALFLASCSNPAEKATTEPYIDDPEKIIKQINAAANWQLQHMDNFEDYIPSYVHRTVERRGWVQGAFYLGLARWAQVTNNQAYFDFLKQHGDAENWQLGDRRYHADDHVIAQFYLHLYEREKSPKFIEHTASEFDQILLAKPTSSLDFPPMGKLEHEGYEYDCQKRWCWSDALFMSPPVWFHLSKLTGDMKYADYADQEYRAITDYLLDDEYNLYFRDSRFLALREDNGAKIFWSRGNGWVYSGLTQVIDFLPANDPRRTWYIDLFKRMSASLKQLQFDNGYWPVSLAAGKLHPVEESSGTAFFTSGLAWGLKNGYLNEEYRPTVTKAWQALLKAQLDNGMIGSVQQIGYAPDKVSPNETQLYGAGAFLLAGTEVLLLEQSKK